MKRHLFLQTPMSDALAYNGRSLQGTRGSSDIDRREGSRSVCWHEGYLILPGSSNELIKGWWWKQKNAPKLVHVAMAIVTNSGMPLGDGASTMTVIRCLPWSYKGKNGQSLGVYLLVSVSPSPFHACAESSRYPRSETGHRQEQVGKSCSTVCGSIDDAQPIAS